MLFWMLYGTWQEIQNGDIMSEDRYEMVTRCLNDDYTLDCK